MPKPTTSGPLLGFAGDCRGVSAVEFAMVLPIMLVLLFGVIEITTGVAAKRKLTVATRTLSDLVSREDSADDSLLRTVFSVGGQVMAPHPTAPLTATISEIKVTKDPANRIAAEIHWSKAATFDAAGTVSLANSPVSAGTVVTVPDALQTAGHYPIYLIRSSTSYTYTPMLGYVVPKAGIVMSDETYTKPRQTNLHDCVLYGTAIC